MGVLGVPASGAEGQEPPGPALPHGNGLGHHGDEGESVQVPGLRFTEVHHAGSEEGDVEDVGHQDCDGRVDAEDADLWVRMCQEIA